MAPVNLTLKIGSEILKNGGKCSRNRALHDGVATKKCLHNTEGVVGLVADSMGRSRVKLTGSDMERNGMARVGPSPDILHQVPRIGLDTPVIPEPQMEQKCGYVMTDPNSSMWNLCKSNKNKEQTAKKITKKFIKMKDNIKQYYLDRLEENQVMFTQIEEPLRIGKIDKKERSSRYREMRDEEYEPQEEVAVMMPRPRKPQKVSLFNQLQNKPDLESEVKMGEEIYPEPQSTKGYRKFNKTEYKKSEDMSERGDAEPRSSRMMPKGDDRMFMEQERPLVPSMWKRPQVKPDKETKENRGEGGFSEVIGNIPAVHFKHPKVGLRSRGLLDSLKSGDLVQGFYKKRLNESRNFSTLQKAKSESFDRFKPVPLMLQREIASHCRNRIVDKRISAHSLSTCSKCYNDDDPCRPKSLPQKDLSCDPKEKLPRCDNKPKHEWPCCPKITLCGCDPPAPRTCNDRNGTLSYAKRPEYVCPAFSECLQIVPPKNKLKTECCYLKKNCDSFVGTRNKYITSTMRQERNLGQKYWSAQKQ